MRPEPGEGDSHDSGEYVILLYSSVLSAQTGEMGDEMQSRRAKVVLATIIVVVVFGFILTVTRGDRSRDLVLRIEPIDPSDGVTVYVGGAVEDPGLYELPRGSRTAEALDLAGLLETADTSGLQLAQVLRDEQTINVPETVVETRARSSSVTDSNDSSSSDLVNVNLATQSELQQLPGIGPALAERIRQQRDLNGPFQSLDDLTEVSGISDRMVEEFRDYATVDS